MEVHNNARATLGSRIGAILVAAGGSVGLGNIWKFPYVLGESGGAAFLIVYIGCILLLGMPVMLAEMAIGREAKLNVVGTYGHFSPKWRALGVWQIVITVLTMGFYFVVSGWTAEYFFSSVTGELSSLSNVGEYTQFFSDFVSNPIKPIIFTFIFIGVTHFIVELGINKGIENSAKVLMPVLFVILIALSVNSILIPNSAEGLAFLFKPDFSKITADVFYKAMGQAFFSLSVGFGALITYGSYFTNETKLLRTAFSVTVLDTLVAVIAAVVIFPVVFNAGITPSQGPSLVFITLPEIFNSMPFSILWSSVFFLLLIIAALTSTISLHEVATLYIHEEWKLSRGKASVVTSLTVAVLAAICSLSLGDWSNFTIGGKNLFDSLDYLTSNVMLPISGMGISIFASWVIDKQILRKQFTDYGSSKFVMFNIVVFLLRYICPVLLAIILLNSTGVI